MQKKIYWGATAILSLIYLAGGVMYLTKTAMVQQMWGPLGYPPYLVPILGVLKLAAVVTILWRFSVALSDLAYAAMFFHLLLALSAHINAAQYSGAIPAVVGIVVLLTSFFTQNSARRTPSPYGGSLAGVATSNR